MSNITQMTDFEMMNCNDCEKSFKCYGLIGGIALCGTCYKKHLCCFSDCHAFIPFFGNNPAPLKKRGRCCDDCNKTKVIPERMKLMFEVEWVKSESLQEIAEKKRIAELAEKERIELEANFAEEQRIIELAEADEKRKKEEAKKMSREASKRNVPPYPPAQKEESKQDSTIISNDAAQKKWLKKYVPNWNGEIWSKKRAEEYINDIKLGKIN